MPSTYLGHTQQYWLELQARADTLDATRLIEEIVRLRGKLNFVESRVQEMRRILES